jgi:hypothetical protein
MDSTAHRVVVFDSIHHVLAAERAFAEHGIWCDLVPAPRALSSDCGMVLEYRPADQSAAAAILADPKLRVRGVYKAGPDGYDRTDA